MPTLTINHLVAALAVLLALSTYISLHHFGFPQRICIGASILAILGTAMFWSTVLLGAESDEE